MAIIIPLRITTAAIGLIIGYYAGVMVEYKWKYNNTVGKLADTISRVHDVAGRLADYYTSDDDVDFDPTASCYDFDISDSDGDTTASEE